MNRLHQKYNTEIRDALKKELGLDNINQTPKLEKIVLNAGVGRAVQDSKHLDIVVSSLEKISGQKPVITKAKKSIATYKLRETNPIGVKVTLRGERMWNFLDRLIAVVIPRMRDFRGLSLKSFDPTGNYSIGINDQTVFPEISYEDASATHGLQINLVTNCQDAKQSEAFLRSLGLPLIKNTEKGE
ncbi:MAG: large subunit ribosomal protein [Patescibacteria group bacterium]|jgi:large subunit ribosomal protein L5|nr:large subunit ribosomal protein [Patescibacteria group bacterium]